MLVFVWTFLKSENCHKIGSQPSDLAHTKKPESSNRKESIYIGPWVDVSANNGKNIEKPATEYFQKFPKQIRYPSVSHGKIGFFLTQNNLRTGSDPHFIFLICGVSGGYRPGIPSFYDLYLRSLAIQVVPL